MNWPDSVSRIHGQLEAAQVWHTVAANVGKARSCREAAFARKRLGVQSIPLWDELKTYLGSYDVDGGRKYVAVHCRAHQERDDSELRRILGAPVTRLEPEELGSVFNMEAYAKLDL
jgi:hypothetical protein